MKPRFEDDCEQSKYTILENGWINTETDEWGFVEKVDLTNDFDVQLTDEDDWSNLFGA